MYTKKVEYLKGLMDGLPLDKNAVEYKVFSAILDSMETFSEALLAAEDTIDELEETVEALEESVEDLEDELDSLEELLSSLCGMDEEVEQMGTIHPFPLPDGEGMSHHQYEVVCPGCEGSFNLEEEALLSGKGACPECNEVLVFEFGGGCGGGCCGKKPEPEDKE